MVKEKHLTYDKILLNPYNFEKIKICHAPTNRYYKGSDIIIPICKKLERENYNVKFILIENKTHDEVIQIKKQCDILVDQVGDRGGWGYGMSSIEAMSLGLCCVTQINNQVNKLIPHHPFISINNGNLYEKLNSLIKNKVQLEQIKKDSYEWVKLNHDVKNVSKKIYEIYKSIK